MSRFGVPVWYEHESSQVSRYKGTDIATFHLLPLVLLAYAMHRRLLFAGDMVMTNEGHRRDSGTMLMNEVGTCMFRDI